MTPLPLTVTTTPSGPNSPDYTNPNSKDNMQQINNTTIPQGFNPNKGVVLSSDSLNVPLEVLSHIQNDPSASSRPSLMPLFRTRYVEDPSSSNIGEEEYQTLRNNLPDELKAKLEQDEALPFRERDPDLIALDQSLRFEATMIALLKQLSGTETTAGPSSLNFQNLDNLAETNLIGLTQYMVGALNHYLTDVGPNEPSYDLFLGTYNQMNEALTLLNNKRNGS